MFLSTPIVSAPQLAKRPAPLISTASASAPRPLASDGPYPSNSYSRLMSTLTDEIARRRTFAIISHPDAGKTTLTEKLLLFGGAIQLAGEVRARGDRRRARSDWMAIERERGISVSSAVMSFEHEGSPSTCSTRRATRISPRTPTAC